LRSRLAKRYLLLQDYRRAAKQYEKFAVLRPENFAGWNNLGICYNRLEQFHRAIEAFEKAIECDPRRLHGYVNVAGVYGKRSEWMKASEILQKALPISGPSEKSMVYDKLAWSYFKQDKHNLAIETLEKALDFASNNAQLRDYLRSRRDFIKRAAEGTQEPQTGPAPLRMN